MTTLGTAKFLKHPWRYPSLAGETMTCHITQERGKTIRCCPCCQQTESASSGRPQCHRCWRLCVGDRNGRDASIKCHSAVEYHLRTYTTSRSMDRSAAQSTRDALEILHEISQLLDTGLDKETLSISLGLIQQGVHPEGLAKIIQELRATAEAKNEDTRMDE